MQDRQYVSRLARNDQVQLVLNGHPKTGQYCTVVGVLPNASQQSIHQWYDVRFNDGTYGRFKEENLLGTRLEAKYGNAAKN
jgi:hypothetical protein